MTLSVLNQIAEYLKPVHFKRYDIPQNVTLQYCIAYLSTLVLYDLKDVCRVCPLYKCLLAE